VTSRQLQPLRSQQYAPSVQVLQM